MSSISVTSPAPNSVVTGPTTFTVAFSGLPTLRSVQYYLNGLNLSGPLGIAPYSFTWGSTSILDGAATVYAIAYDQLSNVLATSPTVPFTVNNINKVIGPVSPTDGSTLSGTVTWQIAVVDSSPPGYRNTMYHTDGFYDYLNTGFVGSSGRYYGLYGADYDTTRWKNGPHALTAVTFDAAGLTTNYILMDNWVRLNVTFSNGHAIMNVRPKWSNYRLAPGGTFNVTPMWIYTDNATPTPAPASQFNYGSDRPDFCTVDANGLVTGISPGEAIITIRGNPVSDHYGVWRYFATMVVSVDVQSGLVHFKRDGTITRSYDAGNSRWIRGVFSLSTAEFNIKPGLAQRAHDDGFNTINPSFFLNPADGLGTSFAGWVSRFNDLGGPSTSSWIGNPPSYYGTKYYGDTYDFSFLFSGDDFCRSSTEMAYSLGTILPPWPDGTTQDAINYAISAIASSGRTIGIDMVDEVTHFYGSTTEPIPGTGLWYNQISYPAPVPDSAFTTLCQNMDVAAHVNRGWPILAYSVASYTTPWVAPATIPRFAQYFTEEITNFTYQQDYLQQLSTPSMWFYTLKQTTELKQQFIPPYCPVLSEGSFFGETYLKYQVGDRYVEGPQQPPFQKSPAEQVCSEVMGCVALRKAGIKFYSYDQIGWKNSRKNAAVRAYQPGVTYPFSGVLPTGSEPYDIGTDRWNAIAIAFRTIIRVEQFILQNPINVLDLGNLIATGAREGPMGRLYMAINYSELSDPVNADLTPYAYSGGPPIERHRLNGKFSQVDIIPNATSDSLTLSTGETVIWICRPASQASSVPPGVKFVDPIPHLLSPQTFAAQIAMTGTPPFSIQWILDGANVGTRSTSGTSAVFGYSLRGLILGTYHRLAAWVTDATGNTSEASVVVSMGSTDGYPTRPRPTPRTSQALANSVPDPSRGSSSRS